MRGVNTLPRLQESAAATGPNPKQGAKEADGADAPCGLVEQRDEDGLKLRGEIATRLC